jgi:signal transduction histidine kinase
VHEINRLLHDTQQQLHRSRTALGDLSHALKTPLAVLLNLTERDTLDSDPALREAIALQIEQMRQRISREMALARTAGTHHPETLFDVDTDLPLLLESLRRAHRGKMAIDSRVSLQGKIPWEREDVIELLGNLLDNACKWGREIVRLNLHRVNDQLFIQVDDDGPGIPQDKLKKVLERGERLDKSVIGHGLGLAIVGDKVAAYQGALEFAGNEEDGLSVRILLPWH